jgi:hypothetical protein
MSPPSPRFMADNVSLEDTTQLELNCWVSSTSPHRILSIKLARTAKIASLEREIRNAGSPDYDGLPVDSFRLYKNLGSVACGDDFSTLFPLEDNPQLVELQAETQLVQVLSYNSEKQLLDNHLHIIAQPPDCRCLCQTCAQSGSIPSPSSRLLHFTTEERSLPLRASARAQETLPRTGDVV